MLEEFLLPSLVGAVTWLSLYVVEHTHKDHGVIIHILHRLIRPSGLSGDKQAMHNTILSVVGYRLSKAIRTLQRRLTLPAQQQQLQPLLDRVKSSSDYKRTPCSAKEELDMWTKPSGNTLAISVRNTLQQLILWSSTMNPNPPSYTHRLIYTSLSLIGARNTLRAILDEIKSQTGSGNDSIALDIAAALICAPTVANSPIPIDWVASSIPSPASQRTRINLPEVLKYEAEDAAVLYSKDQAMAEIIIRLHRLVEAQIAVSQVPTDLAAQATIMNTINANIVEDAAAAAVSDLSTGMDLTGDNAGTLAGLGGTDASGGLAGLGIGIEGMDMGAAMAATAVGATGGAGGNGLQIDVNVPNVTGQGGPATGSALDTSDPFGDLGDLGDFSGLDMDPTFNFDDL
jgi:mediator of RNA polymerase II transcription subunit 5